MNSPGAAYIFTRSGTTWDQQQKIHEKRLKDATGIIDTQKQDIEFLKQRVNDLERKLTNQTAYLQELHNRVSRPK
jgi:hypothetical protein